MIIDKTLRRIKKKGGTVDIENTKPPKAQILIVILNPLHRIPPPPSNVLNTKAGRTNRVQGVSAP